MILDPEAGVIHFKNCFVPYGFLTRRVRGWYACELSDIQSVVLVLPKRRVQDRYRETWEHFKTHTPWRMVIDTMHGKVDNISCIP